jgi:DNA integrity scanning protein DisA with diadenylate cyclase activity
MIVKMLKKWPRIVKKGNHAIKLLEKMKVNYEKQTNKLWKHIEFEVGDLLHVVKHSRL